MCLACEQDAIWLAYLDSQGLLKDDDPAAVEELFCRVPGTALAGQARMGCADARSAGGCRAEIGCAETGTEQNPFSCDDPTAE